MRVFVACAGTVVTLLAAPRAPWARQAPAPTPPPIPAPTPTPAPAPTPAAADPAPAPARLRLEIERHIDDVVTRQEESGLPRFEERIEVVERSQAALDELLRGLDLACSPTASGPPPTSELSDFRGASVPPHADFTAVARAILKALKRGDTARGQAAWYLYGVRQGETVRLVVREGEIPASVRYALAGTTWEEIARFESSGEAIASLRRLERGFATATRRTPGEPAPPWAPVKCLPPERR